MFLFIPRSLCALKRVTAKADHPRFAATQGIRIALACGMYRAEATDGRRAVVVQGMVVVAVLGPAHCRKKACSAAASGCSAIWRENSACRRQHCIAGVK
ncbi:MAG TPA: hypothetical protein VE988_03030 [Gemmataceae bacterium]|nr:hypothetical protein [Gemmataceae bacterium]